MSDALADKAQGGRWRLHGALRWAALIWSVGFCAWLASGAAQELKGAGALLALFGGPCGAAALLFAQGAEAEEARRFERLSALGEEFEALARDACRASPQARIWRERARAAGRSLRLFDLRMMQTLSARDEAAHEPPLSGG